MKQPSLARNAPPRDLLANYRHVLQRSIRSLEQGSLVLRVPVAHTLHRKRTGLHFHSTPEVFMQTEGATEFTLAGERMILRAGEICLIPRGVAHNERALECPATVYCAGVNRAGSRTYVLYHNHAPESLYRAWTTVDQVEVADVGRFAGVLDEIAQVVIGCGPNPTLDTYVRALLLTALAWTQRLLTTPVPASRPPAHPLVVRCMELMDEKLADANMGVDTLAAMLKCAPNYLGRLVRRETGRTVMDHIHGRRITRAQDMLIQEVNTMGEVAWACGFSTQSYFNRVFLARTGETPKAFRQSRVETMFARKSG
jgi:AraC-like DNA-binding protein/mannose-6-phosphate isomerase-like protein (cupin superfamily)